MRANLVPMPPSGLVLAVQYWPGDEAEALRLARLLADIQAERRDDVTLALCGRFDCGWSPEAEATYWHCAEKFRVMRVTSAREGMGHPCGANELWSGVMEQLAEMWSAGDLPNASVFAIESDGVPVCVDWLDRLIAEHERALEAGKRVTGTLMDRSVKHINGSLIAHLSMWLDRPSLYRTPPAQAWDLFHAGVLMQECRPTSLILNLYGSQSWSHQALHSLRLNTAWLANTKDTSAIEWAEQRLTAAAQRRAADALAWVIDDLAIEAKVMALGPPARRVFESERRRGRTELQALSLAEARNQ